MKIKNVIEFLEGIKLAFSIGLGVTLLIIMGQAVETADMELFDPTPFTIALFCAGIAITAQLIVWLIQFGSRGDKSEPEPVPEKDVDSVFANIQQAREWVTNAALEFDAAKDTLAMAHDALNEAEQDYKRERHN